MADRWEDQLDAVSVLVEPVRRSMYRFVRSQGRPVSREEVAEATGTSVKLAAFHLDKLAKHGWLRSEYDQTSRPATGGRPPKLYEPTDLQVEVSLPARRYDLMAEILLHASAPSRKGIAAQAQRVAHERGRSAGEQFRVDARLRRLGPERTLAIAGEVLAEFGFEPRRVTAGEVIMANCPFRALADAEPGTVCAATQALAEGVLAGLRGNGVEAVLDRATERCCVVLRRIDSPPA